MKNILLFLITIYCGASCTKERVVTRHLLSKKLASEPYMEQPLEATCIPLIPIEVDTSIQWLGYQENPYQGRREHGWARAEVERFNYEWNASAKAYYFNGNIEIGIETFRNEEDYYAFVERIIFKVSRQVDRCTAIVASSTDYPSSSSSNASYVIGDWDVTHFRYHPDENHQGVLEIMELDTINNRIKGKFDLQVILDHVSLYEELPDTIHFANGVFECDIL